MTYIKSKMVNYFRYLPILYNRLCTYINCKIPLKWKFRMFIHSTKIYKRQRTKNYKSHATYPFKKLKSQILAFGPLFKLFNLPTSDSSNTKSKTQIF